MLFVILGHDAPQALPIRKSVRPAHLEYLRVLQQEGRLLLAGPRPKAEAATAVEAGFHGSLVIAEFATLAAAQAWAEQDPYFIAGVFRQIDVQPFVQVLPA